MNEWKTVKLSDLGEVIGGATPSTSREDYYNGDISWITPKDLAGYCHRYIAHGERNITQAGLNSCSAKIMPRHTILFSSRAPIGYVAIAENDICTNQGFKSIVPNDTTDFLFLYYLLRYYKPTIESLGSGTTFKEVSGATMRNIEVRVPASLDVQKCIGKILDAFDSKIENNNRINDNLQQQAQAIFNNFFPYAVDDELPPGWRVGTIGEVIEIHDYKRVPLSSAERGKMQKRLYPYYGAASLMDYVDDYLFDGVYLLLGEDGTVVDGAGYPILQYVWGQFWVNNHAHILTGKMGYNVESLYLLFRGTPVKSIVTGAVQPKISQANLKSIQMVIPPADALEAFNAQVEPLFDLVRQNAEQNNVLSSLRDLLLPHLMSGEIDVSSVQL